MDHFQFEERTRDMTPEERSLFFHKLSKKRKTKLMDSTFKFLGAMGDGRPRDTS